MQKVIVMTRVLTLLASAALGGCGVSITATHVPTLSQQLSQEGIYYALPRTQIGITVPVVLERFDKGRVGEVFGACLKACSASTPPPTTAPECALPPAVTLRILRPEITARGIPDRNNVYRVSVDAETFAGVKHKLTLNELGVITSAESTAADNTFEVVAGAVGTLAGVLAKSNIAMTTDLRPATAAADQIACKAVIDVKAKLDGYKKEIADIQDDVTRFLSTPREANHATLYIANAKERIARIEAQVAQYRAQSDLEEAKTVFRYRLEAAKPVDPEEFTATGEEELTFKDEAPIDEAQAKAPDVRKALADAKFTFKAQLKPKETIDKCTGRCGPPAEAGFRYRLPRMGELIVQLHKGDGEKTTMFSGLVPIAQYGPIAALQSRFEGKGGSVELAVSDVTGGLSKVAIGAEAVPATAVTAPLEAIGGAVTARRERKAKEAQAERDAQKNELQEKRTCYSSRRKSEI